MEKIEGIMYNNFREKERVREEERLMGRREVDREMVTYYITLFSLVISAAVYLVGLVRGRGRSFRTDPALIIWPFLYKNN